MDAIKRIKFYFICCLVTLNGLFIGYALGLNSRHVLIVDPKLPKYVKPTEKAETAQKTDTSKKAGTTDGTDKMNADGRAAAGTAAGAKPGTAGAKSSASGVKAGANDSKSGVAGTKSGGAGTKTSTAGTKSGKTGAKSSTTGAKPGTGKPGSAGNVSSKTK